MADFFAKRKQTAVPKINLIEKETTTPAPPKKKYSKHTTTNGFNSKNVNNHVKNYMSPSTKRPMEKLSKFLLDTFPLYHSKLEVW